MTPQQVITVLQASSLTVGHSSALNQWANYTETSYPPYNIVQLERYKWMVEVAAAGFALEDFDIEHDKSVLIIKAQKSKDVGERKYIHHGIASRRFERVLTMGDNAQVTGASFNNGILSVVIEEIIPEEDKPKKIEIKNDPVLFSPYIILRT